MAYASAPSPRTAVLRPRLGKTHCSGAPAHHHASTRPAIMARSGEVSRCADPRSRSSGPRFSRSLTSNMQSLTLSLKETFLDAED